MAVQLPRKEFFSDSYLEKFYNAHVASSRRASLDEDIAAIEAEINKVQKYRSRFRSYRFDKPLNSCGGSECSDEDDSDSPAAECSPTSVFKVFNSSVGGGSSSSGPKSRGPDIFTWAAAQQVSHDHSYCAALESDRNHTLLDHGMVSIKNIQWSSVSVARHRQLIHHLSCILHNAPPGRRYFSLSSLDLLPAAMATAIRKTGRLGCSAKRDSVGDQIGIKEVKSLQRTLESKGNSRNRRKQRFTPYSHKTEKFRVRRLSNSEGEDPVVID